MEIDQFETLIALAKERKYSSLCYIEYEDLKESEIVVDTVVLTLLYDRSKDIYEIHYICDDLQDLIDSLKIHNLRGLIKFIPYNEVYIFENQGFKTHCAYQDYYLENLNLLGAKFNTNRMHQFATVNDAKTLANVSKSCTGLSRGYFGETEEWFKDWLNDHEVIVKIIENEIIGFCCVSIYAMGTKLWIRELAIRPDFQGKGFGKELMESALQYGLSQGAQKSFLAVDIENKIAIQLYEHFGFEAKENEIEVQMIKLTS